MEPGQEAAPPRKESVRRSMLRYWGLAPLAGDILHRLAQSSVGAAERVAIGRPVGVVGEGAAGAAQVRNNLRCGYRYRGGGEGSINVPVLALL